MSTRFCVFCGELRDPLNGKHVRGIRLRFPTSDRCSDDANTTEIRFDGASGERLNPPPMPPRTLLSSYIGDMVASSANHCDTHRSKARGGNRRGSAATFCVTPRKSTMRHIAPRKDSA